MQTDFFAVAVFIQIGAGGNGVPTVKHLKAYFRSLKCLVLYLGVPDTTNVVINGTNLE